jgi:hypothetical protein
MITVVRFFYILVTHNLIIPKKWLHSLNSEYATFFTVFYFVTASFFFSGNRNHIFILKNKDDKKKKEHDAMAVFLFY